MELLAAYATSVFINLDGGLSIHQPDEDQIVALNREQAKLVAAEIMRLDADDALWVASKDDEQ